MIETNGLISLRGAAQRLNLSHTRVLQLIHGGVLPAIDVADSTWRVLRIEDVEQLAKTRAAGKSGTR